MGRFWSVCCRFFRGLISFFSVLPPALLHVQPQYDVIVIALQATASSTGKNEQVSPPIVGLCETLCRRLTRIPMPIYGSPIRLPLSPVCRAQGGPRESKMAPIEMPTPTFLFDFHTHYRPISHLLTTIHNSADDKQTQRSE